MHSDRNLWLFHPAKLDQHVAGVRLGTEVQRPRLARIVGVVADAETVAPDLVDALPLLADQPTGRVAEVDARRATLRLREGAGKQQSVVGTADLEAIPLEDQGIAANLPGQ